VPRDDALYTILALAVLVLSVALLGTSVFVLGFGLGDSPCVLCWAQRTGMTLVGLMGIFVLRFGPRPRYLGVSVLIAAWGIFMAVRHSAIHVARDIGQGFSIEILGAHTYIWSAFVFWICLLVMGLLLCTLADGGARRVTRTLRPLDRIAIRVFLVVVAGNAVQAFASTGPPPFVGQSDPVRFSLDPRHWVWSLEEWRPAPISWRGAWGVEKPDVSGVATDPAAGPLDGLDPLPVKRRLRLAAAVRGPVTDLAWHDGAGRFLVTTLQGVHLIDSDLRTVDRYTIIDPGFSVDMDQLAGAAFLDASTVMALSRNKSFVVLQPAGGAGAATNRRFFLESFGAFEELRRSRLSTVRARLMYVSSLAGDPGTESFYTLTVPNRRVTRLVVSRFDRRDFLLSEEFAPSVAAASGLQVRTGRSIGELFVTGATVAGGRLYAISAAYSTLLTIDLASRSIVSAHAVAGIDRPTGLALKDHELYLIDAGGDVAVVDEPGTLSEQAEDKTPA
jgi:disulfide bond formation protein DsbB